MIDKVVKYLEENNIEFENLTYKKYNVRKEGKQFTKNIKGLVYIIKQSNKMDKYS